MQIIRVSRPPASLMSSSACAGGSAVDSYSSIVVSLRARVRKSSGGVDMSRRPAGLSGTRGWLLTCSGTVVRDQQLQRVDRDAKHAIHVRRVEVMDLARAQLIDAEVDGARAQLAEPRDHEERRCFHVIAEHPGARPHVELLVQLLGPWH